MTIEEFLALSQECGTVDELGRLFVRAVGDAGYQNVSFVRVDSKGFVALPFLELPQGFADTYIEARCNANDPAHFQALQSSQPFYWSDFPHLRELSFEERQTLDVCREAGAHTGLSIPYHGPDGMIDLIGVSLRDETKADQNAATTGRILALSSILRWRYWQLRNALEAARPKLPVGHAGGPPEMTDAHCKALVLVDLADRRRRMGLREMSLRLGNYVDEADIAFLLSWGYLSEYPDDATFLYQYVVTVIGQRHLATCQQASQTRREAWDAYVPRGERAGGIEN